MSTIATTFPDIPRIYTGIAEWATCLLFIFYMPRKYDRAMTAGIAAAFLVIQCSFLVLTADVPHCDGGIYGVFRLADSAGMPQALQRDE